MKIGANIKISSDSKDLIKEMQQVANSLKAVDSELSVTTTRAKLFGTTEDYLKARTTELTSSIKGNNTVLNLQRQAVETLTGDINKYKDRNIELTKTIAEVESKLKESIKSTGEDTKETKLLQQELNKLQKEYSSNEKAIDKNTKQIDTYKTKINETEKKILETEKALQDTNKTLANSKWDNYRKQIEQTSEKMKSFSDGTKKVGDGLMKLSAPIIAATTAGSKFSMEFGDGMAKISTVADTSKISLDDLGKGVLSLSNMSGEAFGTIQEGMYDTISSGVKAEESVNFLTTAVKAAKGGFTDTKIAVDGLTSTINAYGLESEKAKDIANQMFIAQNLGKTTFGEMSQYLGNVIPISAALKVKTNELFSSIAVLTANGIKSGEAITGLKAAMSNIIKPSKEASDAADSLGIDFTASAVATKGWLPFLQDVKEKLKQASPEFAKESDQVLKNSKRMEELAKAGKKNTNEFKTLSKQNKVLTKDMEMLANMSDSPLSAFAQMFGSVEGLNSILTLTSDQGIKLYSESMDQMKTNTTALDDAFNKVDNTAGNSLRKSLNELKNSAIKLGDAAQPIINTGVDGIKALTKALEGMDKGTLETVTKVGMFTFALGGTIKAVGGVAGGIGNIVSLAGKFKTAAGVASVATEGVGTAANIAAGAGGLAGLGSALGTAAVAAAPWLLAGAAVIGTGYAINKAMSQEAVPAVDLFADKICITSKTVETSHGAMTMQVATDTIKISEATKKTVGAYIKMDDDVTKSMTNLYVNSTKITTDTVTSLTTKFNDMGTQIKTGMDKKYNDMYTTMNTFFKDSGTLSDAEEAEALQKLKQNNEFQKSTVDQGTKEIKAILEKASLEKRELTAEERRVIGNIQDNMKQDAVKSLSDTEVESKVIMERLKDYGTRITAEQASDIIKKANETRDKSVSAANEQYEKTLASIIKMRDESHTITAEQADKLIKNASTQKDKTIEKADEMKDESIAKIKEMHKGIEDEVDTKTGKILNWWDKLKNWWDNWHPAPKNVEVSTTSNEEYHLGRRLYASGTNFHPGGFARVFDSPSGSTFGEILDLPRGTRVYPHDVSMKMATEMAKVMVSKMGIDSYGSQQINQQPIYITNITTLDGKVIAKETVPYVSNSLALETKRRR